MIQVTDLYGYTIKVTDSDAAIRQADEYRHYTHEDKQYGDFDRQQQAYWQYMYREL